MHMIRLLLGLFILASAAAAQDRRPSHCIALADAAPEMEFLHKAGFRDPLPEYTVRLRYVSHASFLIQAGDVSVVTDYAGFLGSADFIPDVVTMNHAHSTHFTTSPDPAIEHVLRGWGPFGEGIEHHLDLGEMLVRNVSTDIRGSFGSGSIEGGNSIFVFEVAGLCIGHLGHLHHVPSNEQFAALGRLDVVMAPVDGGLTLTLPEMIETLQRLKSSVVIPMHWFSGRSLSAFVDGMQEDFRIDLRDTREIEVSLRTLPAEPTVVVLRPRFLGFNDGAGEGARPAPRAAD